jgi:outer membrane immunogenic protein
MNKKAILLLVISFTSPALAQESNLTLWRNGFYAGVNAGYGIGTSTSAPTVSIPLRDGFATSFNNIPPGLNLQTPVIFGGASIANTGNANVIQNGIVGGGQIGYNYLLKDQFVVGVEADFQGSGMQGSGKYFGAANQLGVVTQPLSQSSSLIIASNTAAGMNTASAGLDWIGTARGRFGMLVSNNILIFGTSGFSYGSLFANTFQYQKSSGYVANLPSGSTFPMILPVLSGIGDYSGTRVGWTAGGGAEWMFAPNWSIKSEAIYYNLGSANIISRPAATDNFSSLTDNINYNSTKVSYDGIIARFGLNYHFHQ